MPVPSSITDLSTNPTANSPAGTESAKGTVDDYFRTGFAFIAQLNALVAGSTIPLASADTVAIGAAASGNISITGTTTITAFDTVAEGVMRWVTFAGALTLTHNATKLQLPGAASITTAAGDTALFKSLGGGNWKCLTYQRSGGYIPLSGATPFLSFKPASLSSGPVLWQATQPDGKVRLQLGFDTSGTPFFNTYNGSGTFTGNIAVTAGGFVASGNITCQTLTQTSDERKKKHWQRLPGDFIARLAGIRKSGLFQWKKGGGQALGVGAQSLEQILPQAVHTDDKGAKTVNYGAAALVSAVELARVVVDLQKRLTKLEAASKQAQPASKAGHA